MEWWPFDEVVTVLLGAALYVLIVTILHVLRAKGAFGRAIGAEPIITPSFYAHYIGVYFGLVLFAYAAQPVLRRLEPGTDLAQLVGLFYAVVGGLTGFTVASSLLRRFAADDD